MISRPSSQIKSREISEPFLKKLIRGQTIGIGILIAMVAIGGIFDRSLLALLPLGGLAVIVGIAASLILRRGHFFIGGYVFFIGTGLAISTNVYIRGYQDASTLYYLWPILGAVSILEGRGGVVVLVTSLLSYLTLAIGQNMGFLNPPIPFDPQGGAFLTMGSFAIMFSLLAYLAWLSSQNTKQALDQAQQATHKLQEVNETLENRVAARTKDLATVAEVGSATATILETDKLMQAVVDLTKERFNLYHSHIYLLDQAGENLVLASGAGEPGRIMAAEKRSIPLSQEQSLVARAARERKGVIVNDVTEAPDFLPNPLLPDTRSELAVPMSVGGKVIGVFDVQSDVVGRFGESDINIQTTLAAQVAASIQNVRSFEQSKSQADLESLVNVIGQKIQRATTVDDTLQTAIRELGMALGASRVSSSIARPQVSDDLAHSN